MGSAEAINITEYPIPTPNSLPFSIATGPDGAIWFIEYNANQLGRIDPTTDVITEYPIPTPNSGVAWITTGPDEKLWFTELDANKIGWIDPTTHVITEHPIPTPNSDPWSITRGPDGALWFNECGPNNIARIDPTTHAIKEYPADGVCSGMTSGPDGALWFIASHGAQHPQIGRFDLTTHVVTEYLVPTPNSNPGNITNGPDGALWFTEFNANQIGRIDPTTHVVTEYAIPTPNSGPAWITTGPDENLWFTEAYGNKIGKILLVNCAAPGAPTKVTATAGNAKVTVSFKIPTSNVGCPINSYTVTSSPGGRTATGAGSPITVTGLTNGTPYTFTVKATNAVGTGPPSKKSNQVTPSSITVITPQGGETWQRGKRYTISWNFTGKPGTTVMIELVEGTSSSVIKTSTSIGANWKGSYSWTIPKKHATGSDYKVRITSKTKPSFTATSNGTFTIN